MIHLDIKYLNFASSSLNLFKKKNEMLWNFRCPYCGDSAKKKTKARGYVYEKEGSLFFKCHNCSLGKSFNSLLQYVDERLYSEYIKEKFFSDKQEKKQEIIIPNKTIEKHFSEKIPLESISELPNEHFAKQWILKRKIPYEHHHKLFFTSKFKNFIEKNYGSEKAENLLNDERIVIPFWNKENKIIALQGRSILTNNLRYVTIKLRDETKIYGLDRVNENSVVRIVEGPLDSLFLNNCIAIAGSELVSLLEMFSKTLFIFDNEPENKQIVDNMNRVIESGRPIVIWPKYLYNYKDINDMVIGNLDVEKIINENTHTGMLARVYFNFWKKV